MTNEDVTPDPPPPIPTSFPHETSVKVRERLIVPAGPIETIEAGKLIKEQTKEEGA